MKVSWVATFDHKTTNVPWSIERTYSEDIFIHDSDEETFHSIVQHISFRVKEYAHDQLFGGKVKIKKIEITIT